MSSTEALLMSCKECGGGFEVGPVAKCTFCGGGQLKRGIELFWGPWDSRGARIEEMWVPVLAVKSRTRRRGGHVDYFCEIVGGEGGRWFDREKLGWLNS